jgi:hypothetical protein
MAHIWRRMVGLYGHKWGSQYGRVINENGQLSALATDWKRGLSGISAEKIKYGFERLELKILKSKEEVWPPSWPEFRKTCESKHSENLPSLDETIQILVMMPNNVSSIAKRYKHPLILAVAAGTDIFSLRTAKLIDAKRMVKPVYERILESGWPDFPAHAHIEQKAIATLKPITSKAAGLSAFSEIRKLTGANH